MGRAGEARSAGRGAAAGAYTFRGTLVIPAGAVLQGARRDDTRVEPAFDPAARFPRPGRGGWDQAPSGIHQPGDTIEYQAAFPAAGEWSVWLRYATEMSPWKQPGVSGNMTPQGGNGPVVPLENRRAARRSSWCRAKTHG